MTVAEWLTLISAGTGLLGGSGFFVARATVRASRATAAATEAAARAMAEPQQRQADLEAFREIREDLAKQVRSMKEETSRLRSIVRAFAGYVGELTTLMRSSGIEPPDAPDSVNDYYRTGV